MDFRPHANALYGALRQDAFYHRLEAHFDTPDRARAAMIAYHELSIAEARRWGRVGLLESGVAGISVWSVPLSPSDARRKAEAKKDALRAAMGAACLETFLSIEASMAVHESTMDLADCWYLSILGVDPSEQGKGLGAQLVLPVLEEADRLGVSSYLTTFTPRNIPFYQRLGYADAGTYPEPVTGGAFTVLIRPPGKAPGPEPVAG